MGLKCSEFLLFPVILIRPLGSYHIFRFALFAELSPATFPCWLQWPALTPPMWPRFCYETVMARRSWASELQEETSQPWVVPVSHNKQPSMLSSRPSPTQIHVLPAWAKWDVCSEPEQRMSSGPPPQSAPPLTTDAAMCVAMLTLHHRGELETTVPQMQWGSAGVPSNDLFLLFECFFKYKTFIFGHKSQRLNSFFSQLRISDVYSKK